MTFSLKECSTLLQHTNEKFAEELEATGKTAEQYLSLSTEELFKLLNWMHPVNSPQTSASPLQINLLRFCTEDVLKRRVPGDFLEAGAWKAGSSLLMRGILAVQGEKTRKVWVADSFEGLPAVSPELDLGDALLHELTAPIGHQAISQDYVQAAFETYGLLDDQTRLLPGWFEQSLATDEIKELALLRLDAVCATSTYTALNLCYQKLSPGGYVVLQDYERVGCRQGVDRFREEQQVATPIQTVDDFVFWMKE